MSGERDRVRALVRLLRRLSREQARQVLARLQQTDPAFAGRIRDVVLAVREVEARATPPRSPQTPRVQHIARTLNHLGESRTAAVLAGLTAADPALAEAIRRAMFTFEDLRHADDRGLQRLIAEVDGPTRELALRAAPPEVEARIFAQMSTRAAARLREDIEDAGPARRSEVEEARKLVCAVARRLEGEGRLVLARPGEDDAWV